MDIKKRIERHEYYLNIAKEVARRSTCIRRQYGAIIVNGDIIISTGYNGSPRGTENCSDIGKCKRQDLNIPSGEKYELCRAVHAEANAIINASKSDMHNARIYLFGIDAQSGESLDINECCLMCKRLILNAGIKYVTSYKTGTIHTIDTESWIESL